MEKKEKIITVKEIYERVNEVRKRYESAQKLQAEHLENASREITKILDEYKVKITPLVRANEVTEIIAGLAHNINSGKNVHLNIPFVVLPNEE